MLPAHAFLFAIDSARNFAPLAWVPFMSPLPLWENSRWPWLIVPLCAGVSIVYKSIKCASMKTVAREAAAITLWILLAMAAAAFALAALVRFLER